MNDVSTVRGRLPPVPHPLVPQSLLAFGRRIRYLPFDVGSTLRLGICAFIQIVMTSSRAPRARTVLSQLPLPQPFSSRLGEPQPQFPRGQADLEDQASTLQLY